MGTQPEPSNQEIAEILERIAELLELQDANPFRVQAYRKAASTLRSVDESAADLVLERDEEALEDLPDIGSGLAGAITEIVKTGFSSQLRRLQAEIDPVELLTQVPGLGATLAQRVHDELGVETLPELEQAAHDGRLAQVDGIGDSKLEAVKVSLAGMLSPAASRRSRHAARDANTPSAPSVATLLDVDREYRQKIASGQLRKVAPKRFNPDNEAWLPILNTERGSWSFTALYSNTKRAHELEKTDDWVVLYFEQDGQEDQRTVVTETSGELEGKRVIRGREAECTAHYSSQEPSP